MKHIALMTSAACAFLFLAMPSTASAEGWPDWIGTVNFTQLVKTVDSSEYKTAPQKTSTPSARTTTIQELNKNIPERFQPVYYRTKMQPTQTKAAPTPRYTPSGTKTIIWPDWIGRPSWF